MANVSVDRDTPRRDPGMCFPHPMAANVQIFAGTLVCANADGHATPGVADPALVVIGCSQEHEDNRGGLATQKGILVRLGCYAFDHDSSVVGGMTGKDVYLLDDHTVTGTDGSDAATSTPATRQRAGVLRQLHDGQAWVELG
jgi:hypothetical protein